MKPSWRHELVCPRCGVTVPVRIAGSESVRDAAAYTVTLRLDDESYDRLHSHLDSHKAEGDR